MSHSSFRALVVMGLRAVLFTSIATAAISAANAAVSIPVTDFQGAWAAGVTYNPGAVVTYQGASYICVAQNTHFAPVSHPNFWKVMDAPGAAGAAGPPGPQGPAGPAGPRERLVRPACLGRTRLNLTTMTWASEGHALLAHCY
jgi:hypothetical protein